MKSLLLAAAVFSAILQPTQAETRIRLSAKTESTSREGVDRWKTDYGSYDKDLIQLRTISATWQSTMGDGKGKILVQWIARDKGAGGKAIVAYKAEQDIDLKPGQPITQTFIEGFATTDTKYAALGDRVREGLTYAGWIIRILDSTGKVLAEQSSSPPYLKKFAPDSPLPESP